jgi:hypothetical protein
VPVDDLIAARIAGTLTARFSFEYDDQREELIAIIDEERGWERGEKVRAVIRRLRKRYLWDLC